MAAPRCAARGRLCFSGRRIPGRQERGRRKPRAEKASEQGSVQSSAPELSVSKKVFFDTLAGSYGKQTQAVGVQRYGRLAFAREVNIP